MRGRPPLSVQCRCTSLSSSANNGGCWSFLCRLLLFPIQQAAVIRQSQAQEAHLLRRRAPAAAGARAGACRPSRLWEPGRGARPRPRRADCRHPLHADRGGRAAERRQAEAAEGGACGLVLHDAEQGRRLPHRCAVLDAVLLCWPGLSCMASLHLLHYNSISPCRMTSRRLFLRR